MMSLLAILGSLLALYAITFPYSLARNYITARKTGLPIIVVPIDQGHPLWMVTCVPLRLTFKVSPTYPNQDVHHQILTCTPEVFPVVGLRKTRPLHLRLGVPPRNPALPTIRQAWER